MKYLAIVRGLNEPDNNTPSDEIWTRLIECEPDDLVEKEKEIKEYWSEDYPIGVVVVFIPLKVIKEGWAKGLTIW